MKLMTVLGTRPEIIRLSRIIPRLDELTEHVLIHTGQNYDPTLSDQFFDELGLRQPDRILGVRANAAGEQIGQILSRCEEAFDEFKPTRLLLLGDTNSSLCAIIAKRRGIPVFHMEAGNRCFDDRVPEEVNRRIIDHSSDVLMPYTERSRANLLREGITGQHIFVTGNPIYEVMQHYASHYKESSILETLGIEAQNYFLVTLHRAENVDIKSRLEGFLKALDALGRTYQCPVIVSTHPRTRARMQAAGLTAGDHVKFPDPFGFFDFMRLQKDARCVLSDSGTVQEECAILGQANVTLRDVTERPETVECGSNILSGANADSIELCVKAALSAQGSWVAPVEYTVGQVSETVVRILIGYHKHLEVRAPDASD
jgi:UDP-N-acetylglucosamine 2-epimerase (non-hydrolysing)